MDIKTQKMLADVVLNAQNKTVKPYTTTATVKSVNNGIVYVEIPGSDRDTPVKNSSVSVKKGDVVDLVVSHDDTHITGNRSDVAVPESTAQKMSQTLEATRLEMDNELDLFNNKIKMVNNNIEMQNNTITQFGNTIDQQNNIIEQQNNNITEIGNTVNSQGNTITEIGNKVNSQDNTITEIGNTVNSQGNDITELNNTVNTQGNTITEIGNTVNSQGNDITEIGNKVNSQNNTITELDNTITEIGNTVNSQGNKITEIGNTIELQDSSIKTLDSTVQTLDSTVKTQGSNIETLGSNVEVINSAFIIQDGKLTGISKIVTDILDSGYVTTDLLNANVAWIENGKIKEGAIGTTEIADASITTAKIDELSADVIKTGTIRTERLILTTDEVDPKTGEKKIALITALNAKVNSGEGNILDGAVIADETIKAAKIDVVDLNAFKATIGNFTIGTSSMYNGKTSLKDPTNGVYIGTDGIALGQGSLLGMTDDSPFRVESDGDFHLGAKDSNYINFNAFTGALDINVSSLKIESSNVIDRLDNIDKNAIVEQVVEYYQSTSPTSLTGGSWSTSQPTWDEGTYIWSRTKNTNGKGESSYTTPACITGNTGATGVGVKSSDVTYQSSTSGTTVPTGTWSPSVPSVSAGSYLWTRTVITYTDNTTTTSYSVGKMGNTGSTGATGATGNGIRSTAIMYQAGSSGTSAPTGTWSTSVPSTSASAPYLWTRTIITYTDGTTTTSYNVGSTPEGIVVGGRNLIVSGKLVYGFPSPADGSIVYDQSYKTSDFIPLKSGETYTVSWRRDGGVTNAWLGVFYYKSDKTFIYRDEAKRTGNPFVLTRVAPTECAYLRVYWQCIVGGNVKLELGNKATDWTPAPEDVEASITEVKTIAEQTADKFSWLVKSGTSATNFELTDRTATLVANHINLNGLVTFSGLGSDAKNKINSAENAVNNLEIGGRNLIVSNNVVNGYVDNKGAVISENGYKATDYIPVTTGDTLIFQLWSPTVERVWIDDTYFDSNKTYISGYNGNMWFENSTHYLIKYVIPSGASYIRLSYSWSEDFKYKLEKGNKATDWTPAPEDTESEIQSVKTIADNANNTIADWCYNNDKTYINGGKIYTGSITAKQINVKDLFAQDITATNMTISGDSVFGNFYASDTIEGLSYENSNYGGIMYLGKIAGLIDEDEYGFQLGNGNSMTNIQPGGVFVQSNCGGSYSRKTTIHGGFIETYCISTSQSGGAVSIGSDIVPLYSDEDTLLDITLGSSSKKFADLYTSKFNGTSVNSDGIASTSGYGVTKLSSSYTSSSTSIAANSNAVYRLYNKMKTIVTRGVATSIFISCTYANNRLRCVKINSVSYSMTMFSGVIEVTNGSTAIPYQWVPFFQIPEGFRPYTTIQTVVHVFNKNTSKLSVTYAVEIYTDGKVFINGSFAANESWRFVFPCIMYI